MHKQDILYNCKHCVRGDPSKPHSSSAKRHSRAEFETGIFLQILYIWSVISAGRQLWHSFCHAAPCREAFSGRMAYDKSQLQNTVRIKLPAGAGAKLNRALEVDVGCGAVHACDNDAEASCSILTIVDTGRIGVRVNH